jgi:quinoprotein glucose dehydrogenase
MQPPNELLVAALRVLWEHDAKASINKFIEATQSRNLIVRQLAWDLLAQSDSDDATTAIGGGVQSYLQGELALDVHLNVLEAAKGRLDEATEAAVAEHQRALAERDSLGPWMMALEGGDIESGRRLFFENTRLSCLRCHKVDRAGGEVGPELTMIGKAKDRRYLLESICLPNAQVAQGFETATILNDSGQTFTGIVKAETDEFLDLVQNDGSQIRIPQVEIEARRKGKSSMPDDLTSQMSQRDLRDLVAYLASLQIDPRAAESEAIE